MKENQFMPDQSNLYPPQIEKAEKLETLDDEALARLACQEPRAFTELYQRYLPRVYRYQLAHTGSVPDAQDLTSQTFMAALEGMVRYRGQGTFAAWLMSIAHRKMVDYYRKQRPVSSLELIHDPPASDLPVELTIDRNLDMGRIHQALKRIPSDRSRALVLRIFGGLSAAEIGWVMTKSEAAVKMLVLRGLHDLRQQLLNEGEVAVLTPLLSQEEV